MDILETLDKNKDKIALAALAALAAGGTALAAKKIPVSGLETILSSLTKEGRFVRNVSDDLLARNIDPATLSGRRFIAEKIGAVTEEQPASILKSTSFIKDRIVNRSGRPVKEMAGENVPGAAMRRLSAAVGEPVYNPNTGEARLINLAGSNRLTNADLNDKAVADALLGELSGKSMKNYELQTRILNRAAKKSMPGRNPISQQLNFIKDFRNNQMGVRKNIQADLMEKAQELSMRKGISVDEAYNRLSNAFASVSPKNTLGVNIDLFNEVFDLDKQGAAAIKTGSGYFTNGKQVSNPRLVAQNRALRALNGSFSKVDDKVDLSKVEKMAAALIGDNTTVLDTAELEKLFTGMSERELRQVVDTLFNRGAGSSTYTALNNALDEALVTGQFGNIARVMTGKGKKAVDRFQYQGGLSRRDMLRD